MNAALYYWRATRLRSWRRVVLVALVCGLLGTVALGALAGARRTDTAYGRYLASINASDVYVNVPGPSLAAVRQIERLPGVLSAAAELGLAASPVVRGRVDDSFTTDAVAGSLDGEYFRQDRVTVVAGAAPPGRHRRDRADAGAGPAVRHRCGRAGDLSVHPDGPADGHRGARRLFDVHGHRDRGCPARARGPVRQRELRPAATRGHGQVPGRGIRIRVGGSAAARRDGRHPGAAARTGRARRHDGPRGRLARGHYRLQHPPPGHPAQPGTAGDRAAGGRAGHLRRTGGTGTARAHRAGPSADPERDVRRRARVPRGSVPPGPRPRSRSAWTA